jgi:hypothetical protein
MLSTVAYYDMDSALYIKFIAQERWLLDEVLLSNQL